MHELNHDEKSGLCTLPALVNDMETRYEWLDSNIRNAKVATLTMEWWKVFKAVRDNRRFPDHDLWWFFFLSGLDFIMPHDAGAKAKELSSDDLMCKCRWRDDEGGDAVTKTYVPVDVDQPGDHGIGEQPKVRGSRKAPKKRVAADLVVSNAEFSRLANVERSAIRCKASRMWAPILYLKRHNISVTNPNDTAMFDLVRGVLKWAFLKTCVVNGTHATKTSTVLNALKKAIVARNPSIFTDDVARGLAGGPPAASHGGEANGGARADSWNLEDVFQEADTLELAPPLGKPEPEIKDSTNHYAMFKRFLEDETMMLNMIEFVGSLKLNCSWKWKVAKIMSNFMESFTARAKPQNGLRAVLQDLYESLEMFVPVDYVLCRSCERVHVRSAYSSSSQARH